MAKVRELFDVRGDEDADNVDNITVNDFDEYNIDAELREEKKKKRVRRQFSKSNDLYISKDLMFKEILKYHENGIITEELGEMFLKLATRFVSSHKFNEYTYKEDFIGNGVMKMVATVHKFDITRPDPNPFCYFTEVMFNEVRQILNKEKRQRDLKYNLRDLLWEEVCNEEQLDNSKSNGLE